MTHAKVRARWLAARGSGAAETPGVPAAGASEGTGECPSCGGLAAFVKEIDTTDRRATLKCQNLKCEHESDVGWPMKP